MKKFKLFLSLPLILLLFIVSSCNKENIESSNLKQVSFSDDTFFIDDYVTQNNENVISVVTPKIRATS